MADVTPRPPSAARPKPRSVSSVVVGMVDGSRLVVRAAEREFDFYRKSWKGMAFTHFAAPALFLVALGVGVGGLVTEPSSLGGLDYIEFITAGMVVSATAQVAGNSSLWPVMAGHRWIGFHRAMVSSPIGPKAIVAGYILWLAARAMAQAVVFIVVGALLGGVSSGWAFLAVPVAGLAAVALAAPLMAYTATCDSDRAFDPILRVVITPLYLFSGAFFATESLPAVLEAVVMVFPLWHGIELARSATTGLDPTLHPAAHLAALTLWLGAGWRAAQATFARRLTP